VDNLNRRLPLSGISFLSSTGATKSFSLSRRERVRVRAVALEHRTLTSILSQRARKKKRRN